MNNTFFKTLENSQVGDTLPTSQVIDHLAFNEQDLIPVIAQQHDTGEVLMMAWMNRDALLETLEKKRVCYWSRSRQQLWRKGETSGHQQRLVDIRVDCDGDALLCLVEQTGPACHTHRHNCFYMSLQHDQLTTIAGVDD